MTLRLFQIVRCLRCYSVWDEEDPDAEVCACISKYGERTVVIISEGVTNSSSTFRVAI